MLLPLQLLLLLPLFVIVRRMAKFVTGSLNLIPTFSKSSKHDIHLTRWQYCWIYDPDLPTFSVITGMRGTKACVSPPRRSSARLGEVPLVAGTTYPYIIIVLKIV